MKLSSDTLIPVSALTVIGSACIWLGALDARTKTHTEEIAEVTAQQHTYNKSINKIDERLARIEGMLERHR